MPNTAVAVAEKPSTIFREKSASLMQSASEMSLHGLVDEFLRLTEIIEASVIPDAENYRERLTSEGQVALRDRKIINVATRARFGLVLDSYDRGIEGDEIPY